MHVFPWLLWSQLLRCVTCVVSLVLWYDRCTTDTEGALLTRISEVCGGLLRKAVVAVVAAKALCRRHLDWGGGIGAFHFGRMLLCCMEFLRSSPCCHQRDFNALWPLLTFVSCSRSPLLNPRPAFLPCSRGPMFAFGLVHLHPPNSQQLLFDEHFLEVQARRSTSVSF